MLLRLIASVACRYLVCQCRQKRRRNASEQTPCCGNCSGTWRRRSVSRFLMCTSIRIVPRSSTSRRGLSLRAGCSHSARSERLLCPLAARSTGAAISVTCQPSEARSHHRSNAANFGDMALDPRHRLRKRVVGCVDSVDRGDRRSCGRNSEGQKQRNQNQSWGHAIFLLSARTLGSSTLGSIQLRNKTAVRTIHSPAPFACRCRYDFVALAMTGGTSPSSQSCSSASAVHPCAIRT